eukprot:3941889-Rhodomonas_salina.3
MPGKSAIYSHVTKHVAKERRMHLVYGVFSCVVTAGQQETTAVVPLYGGPRHGQCTTGEMLPDSELQKYRS